MGIGREIGEQVRHWVGSGELTPSARKVVTPVN